MRYEVSVGSRLVWRGSDKREAEAVCREWASRVTERVYIWRVSRRYVEVVGTCGGQ